MSEPLTPTTPPPPPVQPPKRSPMFWVAIGCGVIILLGFLALAGMCAAGGMWFKRQASKFEQNPAVAAAELAVRANPELELVESDTEKGTITYRHKETGEVVTVNAAEFEGGKWTVETKEGTATFGGNAPQNLPAWVPVYPGGSVTGNFDTTSGEGRSVAFTMTTPDSVAAVLEFYESQLQGAGLTVQKTTFDQAGTSGGTVGGTSQDEKRSASVMVSTADGQTSAVVSFTEKP
ncbi:MAG TPA: hypothetical protein VNJ70_05365 [Thermoanaerobaculia bacterium]|nr:hypothetical protein [Thermoanaerobaculia bacterium]